MARKHDDTYKLIFSQRAAVEDLVRNFVGDDLAEELDFGTLEALPPIASRAAWSGARWICSGRFVSGQLALPADPSRIPVGERLLHGSPRPDIHLPYLRGIAPPEETEGGRQAAPGPAVTVYNGQEQVHRDGVQQGLERGLEQGLERGRTEGRRALVERLATRKFGAATGSICPGCWRISRIPETFAEVADAIMECDSDAELIARVGA